MADKAVRVRIRGEVQAVGFRFWTIDEAHRLGVRGWVRNRADGSVEAVFAGPDAAVDEMVRRCGEGPPMARVASVDAQPETGDVGPGFHAAPTE